MRRRKSLRIAQFKGNAFDFFLPLQNVRSIRNGKVCDTTAGRIGAGCGKMGDEGLEPPTSRV